ncbi:MAG: hypothetical protein DWQ08_01770 [Proteobacteria bacterium]|nr:MAG: hypothetical protein DWQ08_01770 [Pseudomonadota bacterium]
MRDRETDRVSNMLGALLMQLGCRISGVVHAAGRRDAFAGALTVGGADAVIGIGGTGQGWNDEAVDVLVAVGEIAFHGIGLHPGETTAVGYVEGRPVVLLPGMPLAAFVGADLIAARLVRRLSGASGERFRATWRGVLTRKVSSRLGRVEICRVRCEGDLVEPIAVADGSTLATAVRADGFIAIPASSEGVGAGEEVSVILYDCNP